MSKLIVIFLIIIKLTLIIAPPLGLTEITIKSAVEAVQRIFAGAIYFSTRLSDDEMIKLGEEVKKEIIKTRDSLLYYKDVNGKLQKHPDFEYRATLFRLWYNEPISNDPFLDHSEDAVITESELDHFLRNFRPISNNERKLINEASKSVAKSDSYIEDIDPDFHSASERKFYRSRIKKYNIIHPKLMLPVLEARYQRLRETCKGKSKSILINSYKNNMYLMRFKAQEKLWNRNRRFQPTNVIDNFDLVSSDSEYRKYLNFHEDYYKGNVIYGYKNRRDKHSIHDIGFEVTASQIIGKRFDLFHELFNNLRNFKVYYESEVKNDALIDYLIASYELLTYEYPQSRFKANQWVSESTINENFDGPFVIIPKHYRLKNPEEICKKVDIILTIERVAAKRKFKNNFKAMNFQKSLLIDRFYARSLGIASSIQTANKDLRSHRFRLMLEVNKKLLSNLKETSLDLFESQPEFGINKDNLMDHKIDAQQTDRFEENIKNLFDKNSNDLLEENKFFKQDSNELTKTFVETLNVNKNKRNLGDDGDSSGSLQYFLNSNNQQNNHFHTKKPRLHH